MSILVRLIALLVFAVTVAAGMIVAFTGAIAVLTGWMSACHQVARRLHGYSSFSWSGRPQIHLNYNNGRYRLRYPWWNRNSVGETTELVVHGHDPRIRLWVATRPPEFRFWEGWRMSPVPISKDVLLPTPLAFANNVNLGRKILSSSTLQTLSRIQKLSSGGHFEMSLCRGTMVLSIAGQLRDVAPLEQFLRQAVELNHQIQLQILGEGIEFISTDGVCIIDEIICPVCNSAIERNLVTCNRCGTPHCRDCWEYNGKCATYACGETNYRRSDARAERMHAAF